MTRLIPLVIFLISFSNHSLAQVANSSIFPGMKSINPAVISLRPSATLAAYAKIDQSVKEQDLSSGSLGPGSKITEKGDLSSFNIFYGGKGGGITTELLADLGSGEQKIEFVLPNSSQGASNSSAEADATYLGVGVGIGQYLGISFARLGVESKSSFSTSITSGGTTTAINTSTDIELATNRLRLGLRSDLLVDFGVYYELQQEETKAVGSTPGESGTIKNNYNTVGVGVGKKSKNFHLEVFYEKTLDNIVNNQKTYSPSRFGGTIESYFGSLSLGYTGMFYSGGFSDLERTMYDILILSNTKYESRLENTFNFAFGSGKGHSFGGSAFFSTVESSENSKLDSANKYPTTTTLKGASLTYNYSF